MCICCMVEEETPPLVMLTDICDENQVHSHMHILWGSLLYVVNQFCSLIPYINPLKVIVINYQNGGD